MSPLSAPRVVAVVPAHEEEATIARTVKALLEVEGVSRVVVAADGCTDRTAEEAAAAGALVWTSGRRAGKGPAVEAVIERGPPAEVYVLVDGDVGDSASEAGKLLPDVLAGRMDLAVGCLPALAGGGFGVVKRLARWAIRGITGFEAHAPLSGQRAITREALEACLPLADGFGMEVGMTIDALRLGFRVGEVPVDMTHRATGRGPAGFAHRGRQGLDALRAVIPRALGVR